MKVQLKSIKIHSPAECVRLIEETPFSTAISLGKLCRGTFARFTEPSDFFSPEFGEFFFALGEIVDFTSLFLKFSFLSNRKVKREGEMEKNLQAPRAIREITDRMHTEN